MVSTDAVKKCYNFQVRIVGKFSFDVALFKTKVKGHNSIKYKQKVQPEEFKQQ